MTIEEYKALKERLSAVESRAARLRGVLSEKESQKEQILARNGVQTTEELIAKRDKLQAEAEAVYAEATRYVQELSLSLGEVEALLRGNTVQ